jgi:hypothetical protein
MALLGLSPSRSWIEVDDVAVRVRMGWAAKADIPRYAVASVDHDKDLVGGWGVHGWRGKWLVNGSSKGMVRIELNQPVQARMGGLPVELRVLRVSLEDPNGFISALGY